MIDPYVTMGLAPDADETAVRKRYLELVRQHPPDRSPDRFAEIRAAYEALRDPVKRLESKLLELKVHDSVDEIIADVRARLREERFSTELLLSLAELP